jgi:outer membrane protein assembly factor BamB
MRPITGLAVAATVVVGGLAPAVPAAAAAASAQQWTATSQVKTGNLTGEATAVSPDGSTVFVTGTTGGVTGAGQTVAYSATTGARLWRATFDPGRGRDDNGLMSIAVSPDGSAVFVTGTTGRPDPRIDNVTIAYDAATGAKLWEATGAYDHDLTDSTTTVSPSGSAVYVTGSGYTAAYSAATGAVVWQSTVATGDSVAVTPDGSTVFVTGNAETTALAAATGATVWQDDYQHNASFNNAAVSPDGSTVYASGTAKVGGARALVTVAYGTASGTGLWVAIDGRTNSPDSTVDGLAATPDGSAVVVSETDFESYHPHWTTVALSPATGATLWTRTFQVKQSGGATASALALSPDGSTAYVTGFARGPSGSARYVTTGYSTATGSTVWTASYRGRTYAFAYGLAVSPDGSEVFVTGGGEGKNNSSFFMVTVAYRT